MISYLEGKIILKKENFVILAVNGVGYEVFVSPKSLEKIPTTDEEAKLFCYLDVGERSLKLFGFLSFEELELFKLVRSVSGVGPKAGLEISSLDSPEKIKEEIEKGNETIFESVPGIGKQKARKIILELSGKLKTSKPAVKQPFEQDEAFSALLNLGFSKEQVKRALASVPKNIDSQERVKRALGHLST